MVSPVRLAWLVFGVSLAGFFVAPVTWVGTGIAVLIYTFIALYYLPVWALLVTIGIGARWLQRRRRPSPGTPARLV